MKLEKNYTKGRQIKKIVIKRMWVRINKKNKLEGNHKFFI